MHPKEYLLDIEFHLKIKASPQLRKSLDRAIAAAEVVIQVGRKAIPILLFLQTTLGIPGLDQPLPLPPPIEQRDR